MKLALLGLCGALGVYARYGVGLAVGASSYPLATLSVNVVGSLLAGLVYALFAERAIASEEWRLALMVGFLGGFTTFSAYSLELAHFLEEGKLGAAAGYVALSAILGVGAVIGGLVLGRAL